MKLLLILLGVLPAVFAYTDVALGKTSTSSSVYQGDVNKYGPQKANDGITSTSNFYHMFHSALEYGPWWKVDLVSCYSISEVTVLNRQSTPDVNARLDGFEVLLFKDGQEVFRYTNPPGTPPFENIIPVSPAVLADTVKVQLPSTTSNFLQLTEVIVEGDDPPPPSASGDPHFKMWTGEKYDFHGACDLVLLQNPAYGNGLGMDIHIRTKFTEQWSYISTAVLKIGDETFEVMGGDKSKYWINKVEGQELSSGISGFAITRKEVSSISTEYEVDLKDGSVVFFKTYKNFVRVEIDRAKSPNFVESLGMMGSYKGKKIGRDGKTVVEDNNEFGLEWQVLPSEPMLFHNVEGAQAPETCPLPVKSKGRRRLGESRITMKDAQIACARVSAEDRDNCIFDVMATNDKEMAGAY